MLELTLRDLVLVMLGALFGLPLALFILWLSRMRKEVFRTYRLRLQTYGSRAPDSRPE